MIYSWIWLAGRTALKEEKPPVAVPAAANALAEVSALLSYPRWDLTGLDSFQVGLPDTRSKLSTWVSAIVSALSRPPASQAVPLFPPDATPTSVFLDERQNLYIDFPSSVTDHGPAGVELETLTLEALLRSIGANVPNVSAVKILVNGDDRETLWGHVDIRRFLPVRPISIR